MVLKVGASMVEQSLTDRRLMAGFLRTNHYISREFVGAPTYMHRVPLLHLHRIRVLGPTLPATCTCMLVSPLTITHPTLNFCK